MDPTRWKQIEEIFHEAIDLEGEERERKLFDLCGEDADLRLEVEKLIARSESEKTFLESPVWTDSAALGDGLKKEVASFLDAESARTNDRSFIGRKVGVYVLIEQIGKGGMGVVYAARRADGEFEQKAAIKLIKKGMDTDFIIGRFRHERQILASLNHPNIARLLDGGTLEGSPYFVMEFIEGEPLFRYAEKNGLDLRSRLDIFLSVCRAISYAHHNKIIHRDIKPGNILVDAGGTPKLLDFGIAKILDPDLIDESINPTATAMRLMTPEYASPEQVRGLEITPASDQYSLGALLYELVTGTRPYKFSSRAPHEIARVICEEVPTHPTELGTRIGSSETRRNLVPLDEAGKAFDRIVMRALQKDPGQRYASVEDFAADIESLLRGDTKNIALTGSTLYAHQPSTGENFAGAAMTTGENFSPITAPVRPVKVISPRWRGVKQGLFALLGTFLFIPVLMIFGLTGTIPLPGLVGFLMLMIFGSLLRVAYTLFFESGTPEPPALTAEPLVDRAETRLADPPALQPVREEKPPLPSEMTPAARSLAVLPFKILNATLAAADTGDYGFLRLGLADALVTRLSNVKKLVVRPTSAVLRYDGPDFDTFDAGADLNVDFLLEGTIMRSAERMRVSIQLLNVQTRSAVWAERYDEEITDILDFEDKVSSRVVGSLIPQLTGEERRQLDKRGTESLKAFEAYLHGRFHWNTLTDDGFRQAMIYYKKAITLDPGYALAYAAIADYYVMLGVYNVLPVKDFYPPAKEAALRAIDLDNTLSEAYTALALAVLYGEYDWAKSEESFRRAIELNPNNPFAHLWFSHNLYSSGRFDEGTEELNRAIKLDPGSFQNQNTLAWSCYFRRDVEQAITTMDRIILDFPTVSHSYFGKACFLNYAGRTDEALDLMQHALKLSKDSMFAIYGLAQCYGAAGERQKAENLIEKTRLDKDKEYFSYFQIAQIYCYLGEKDMAFEFFERSLEERESLLIWLAVEPSLDIIRGDERYNSLLTRIAHPLDRQ